MTVCTKIDLWNFFWYFTEGEQGIVSAAAG